MQPARPASFATPSAPPNPAGPQHTPGAVPNAALTPGAPPALYPQHMPPHMMYLGAQSQPYFQHVPQMPPVMAPHTPYNPPAAPAHARAEGTEASAMTAPPAFSAAPSKPSDEQRIAKLAEYTARNGPAFEAQVRSKQANNPEYAFLTNGPGSGFYAWCLFCAQNGLNHKEPLPAGWTGAVAHGPKDASAAAAAPAAPRGALPPAVAQGFCQILESLQGTQESIKTSSAWFVTNVAHAPALVHMMVAHMQLLPAFEPALHVIYLMNDILVSRGSESEQREHLAAVFKPHLDAAFGAAMVRAGGAGAAGAGNQLTALLDFWRNRGVYDAATVDALKASMSAVAAQAGALNAAPMAPPPTPPHPQAGFIPPGIEAVAGSRGGEQEGGCPRPRRPEPRGWQAPAGLHGAWAPPAAPQSGPVFGGAAPHAAHTPGGWRGASGHMDSAPRTADVAAAAGHAAANAAARLLGKVEPEPAPYDILSFPAGLIPKLVAEHLKYEPEYTPLRQDDIDAEAPPQRPTKDQYLQSRLDRFYAELAQYQPGQDRAAYEAKLAAMGDGLLPPAPTSAQHEAHLLAVSAETNTRSDGSYAGVEMGRGGLGANSAGDSDPYAAYRRQKSGRYHCMMATKSTNPNRPPLGH